MSDRIAENAGREERDAPIDPPAYSRDGGSIAGCLIVGCVIGLPALLYFGLFGAILLDELVLDSNWFVGNLPDEAIEFLRVVYAPLLWLAAMFDG